MLTFRTAARQALAILTLAALAAAALGAYEEEPCTDQATIDFFGISGFELITHTAKSQKGIAQDQRGIGIHLNKYALDTVPEQIVQGIAFKSLFIYNAYAFWQQPQPLNKAVVEKVLGALGTVHADTLIIHGLADVVGLEGDADLDSALSDSACIADGKTLSEPHTVHTKHLVLGNMSEASIRWLLALLDVSECELVRWLQNASVIQAFRARTVSARRLCMSCVSGMQRTSRASTVPC